MGIYFCRFYTLMSQQILYISQVGSRFKQMRCKTVTQSMNGDAFFYTNLNNSYFQNILYASGRILSASKTFKHPFMGFVFYYILTKSSQCFLSKQSIAIFLSFALFYTYLHSLAVYILYFQIHGLANPQSSGIYGHKNSLMLQIHCHVQNGRDFFFTQHFRQSVFLSRPVYSIYFMNSAKNTLVKELDSVDRLVLIRY